MYIAFSGLLVNGEVVLESPYPVAVGLTGQPLYGERHLSSVFFQEGQFFHG